MDPIQTLKEWIDESKRIVFFGGAGVSTESVILQRITHFLTDTVFPSQGSEAAGSGKRCRSENA